MWGASVCRGLVCVGASVCGGLDFLGARVCRGLVLPGGYCSWGASVSKLSRSL